MIGSKIIVKFCSEKAFKSIESSQGQSPLYDKSPSLIERYHRGYSFTAGPFYSPTTRRAI
jgi:hypothetical protein